MTDHVRLAAALADRYTIERELGQGGMATVYLALDLKHHRQVAIKVLRPELAATLGPERFTQEIEIAARLQHPHILPVHDSGEAGGFLYYVMPFVDGESLRERLTSRGELPIHDAVRLLAEVTEALAYAHARGVVHRDIKPENVMISGRHALVMDFGVAKAVSEASGRNRLTTAGVALGTPAYMAPEQASADPNLDQRVDIYALGVLGYELLAGRPPFTGATPQQVLAAHVTTAPEPVTTHRSTVSPTLSAVIMRALQKRPADRWQTADEMLAQLEPLTTPSGGMTPTETQPITAVPAAASPRSRVWSHVLIGTGVLVVAAGAWMLFNRPPDTAALQQAVQLTRSAGIQEAPIITSDGKAVAYRILGPGDTAGRVELRRGADGSAVSIAAAGMPRSWSPDGDRLLMVSRSGLQSVPSLGGVATTIEHAAGDGAWSRDGQQLAFVLGDSVLVRRRSGSTVLLARNHDPYALAWSPDGKWIAYVSGNSQYLFNWNIATSSLWLVPAAGGTPVQLTPGTALDISPTWAPDSRRLLFVSNRGGTRDIYQLNLDSRGRPRGDPVRITLGLNASQISLSADGAQLAYSVATNRSNVWSVAIPATGSVSSLSATPVTSDVESVESIDVSRDGTWLFFDSDRSGIQQIFRRPLAGGDVQQVSRGSWPAFSVTVSPDGKDVAYHAIVNGHRRVFATASDGSQENPVQVSPGIEPDERNPMWSPDGTRIAWQVQGRVYLAQVATRKTDGWGPPLTVAPPMMIGTSTWGNTTNLVAEDSVNHRLLLIDPDQPAAQERLIAENVHPVGSPVVSSDGRTLFYLDADRLKIWAVPVLGGAPREVVRFDDPLHPHAD
ncbi:MAG: protein kinase domain-containing protein, partial [Gemmatimonadales bacterium]